MTDIVSLVKETVLNVFNYYDKTLHMHLFVGKIIKLFCLVSRGK